MDRFDLHGSQSPLAHSWTRCPGGDGCGHLGRRGYLQQPWEDIHIEKAISPDDLPAPPPDERTHSENRAREDGLPIVLDGALFDTEKDTLKAGAEARLRTATGKLASYPGRYLVIEGYTDTQGHGVYDNQSLSERRAKRVKQWLITNASRKDSDMIARGYGEQFPVASNQDEVDERRIAGWKYTSCRLAGGRDNQ